MLRILIKNIISIKDNNGKKYNKIYEKRKLQVTTNRYFLIYGSPLEKIKLVREEVKIIKNKQENIEVLFLII